MGMMKSMTRPMPTRAGRLREGFTLVREGFTLVCEGFTLDGCSERSNITNANQLTPNEEQNKWKKQSSQRVKQSAQVLR